MNEFESALAWIEPQTISMTERVTRWAQINSGTLNRDGLDRLFSDLEQAFGSTGAAARGVEIGPAHLVDAAGEVSEARLGRVLLLRKRPESGLRVLLVGHMDTVFQRDHPFQIVERSGSGRLRGPGVTDAKGGLAVILTAVEALERTRLGQEIGWEVMITPDEEIGSPGSSPVLAEAATRNHVAFVFEPAHPDGALIGARKGSGNYTCIVRGRAAHAGRNPDEGRNAVHALADLVVDLMAVDRQGEGIRINVGVISGGEAVNVVPDRALCRFNVRVGSAGDQDLFEAHLARAVARGRAHEGISVDLYGGFSRPPMPLNQGSLRLLKFVKACGESIGLDLSWRDTGGVSDANLLAAAGLPTADGLGPTGDGIHTAEEFLELGSMVPRARLVTRCLLGLAAGEFPTEVRGNG